MRTTSCAVRWPRAIANYLTVTASLSLAAGGCAKPSAVAELPDTSGTAVVEAEQESVARKRESALAGGPVAPRDATAVTPTPDARTPDSRVARTEARPAPYDQSGLNPRRSSTAATPPAIAATPRSNDSAGATTAPGARRPANPPVSRDYAQSGKSSQHRIDDAEAEVQLTGASWVGAAGERRVEPVAAETPGKATLDSPQGSSATKRPATSDRGTATNWTGANRTASQTGASQKETDKKAVGVASLDAPKAPSAETRFQVDRLMVSARLLLSRGELFSAYRTALLAERVASRDKVHFSPEEEHPADLVRLIDREITLAARTTSRGPGKELAGTKSAAAHADEFSEASSRFAAWRPASNAPKSKFASMTSERSEAFEHGSGQDAAGFASTKPAPDLPAAAWKNPSGESPVILSSAISSADGIGTPDTLGLVVPAIEERKSIAELRPFEDRDAGAASGGELFQPKLPAIDSMHSHDHGTAAGATEVAFTPTGPLLPSQESAGSRLDIAWDDDLVAAASTEGSGSGTKGWALTGGIVAIGVVLTGLARRLRAAR